MNDAHAFQRKIEKLAGIFNPDHRGDFVLIAAKAEDRLSAASSGSAPANALCFEHYDFQARLGAFNRGRKSGDARTQNADIRYFAAL